MGRTQLTFLPYHQDDIVITHLSLQGKPSFDDVALDFTWEEWQLLTLFQKGPVPATYRRTIATWCLRVRMAPLGHWPGPQSVAFPFSTTESSGVVCDARMSSLAPRKWVYSLFCKKSLDSVSCIEIVVLASRVAFCHVHRPQRRTPLGLNSLSPFPWTGFQASISEVLSKLDPRRPWMMDDEIHCQTRSGEWEISKRTGCGNNPSLSEKSHSCQRLEALCISLLMLCSPGKILDGVSHSLLQGSSQPKDWTCVTYIFWTGRWILYH